MRLFLAYAHGDYGQLKHLADILHDHGHATSIAFRLMPGADWQQLLTQAIDDYDAVIYAISPESVVNEWCRWQVGEGVRLGKPIFPVILRPTSGIPTRLGEHDVPDFSEGPSEAFSASLLAVLRDADDFRLPSTDMQAPQDPRGVPAQAHEAYTPPGPIRSMPTQD